MPATPELVESLTAQLEAAVAASNHVLTLSTLRSISELEMNPSLLRSLSIARIVGKQRKSTNAAVAALAGDVVSSWKKTLDGPPASSYHTSAAHSASSSPVGQLDLPSALSASTTPALALDAATDSAVRVDDSRMRVVRGANVAAGNVVYWMSRDQRIADNWALLKAQELALANKAGLAIVFCLSASFLGANKRHFGFMLRGLKELESRAVSLNIRFHILCGAPQEVLPAFIADNGVSTVVCDFSPLRIAKEWKSALVAACSGASPVQIAEVDAHNIAPCFRVSDKCEFSARTIRTKIHNAMNTYLTEFPPVVMHPYPFGAVLSDAAAQEDSSRMWTAVSDNILPQLDDSVEEINWLASGESAAWKHMRGFIPRLKTYGEQRNDPCVENGVSHLSPYFHFGQLSVQRVLLEIKRTYNCGTGALFPSGERTTGIHSFCEEAVVRRELSDNFCNYNSKYDSIEGAHNWAQTTLREHWDDARATLYSLEQLESTVTADQLWNAAQREMAIKGKMHGFMRMYWAKKILEWSPDPSEALRRAIYLNDKYSIDGRDPNGFVGCMWAIAGVHDRAWGRRPVFGTIRYMNYDGCKRKFDVPKYIRYCNALSGEISQSGKPSSSMKKTVRSYFASDADEISSMSPSKKKARK